LPSYQKLSNHWLAWISARYERYLSFVDTSISVLNCSPHRDRYIANFLKPVFHWTNLFARKEKNATWLAGDEHWRHHQPIKFTVSRSRQKIANWKTDFNPLLHCINNTILFTGFTTFSWNNSLTRKGLMNCSLINISGKIWLLTN
jgi:hypothetical protein